MVSLLIYLVLLHAAVLNKVAGNVVLTSTVEENGKQFACNGEMVTFTCQVFRSFSLLWSSPLISPSIIFPTISMSTSISRPPFVATLTSIAGSGVDANYTSTLQVNASRTFARTDTTVVCLNQRGDSEESNFTAAEIPDAPMNFTVSRVERVSGGGSVTIMASWMRPQNYEQFDIDRYNFNVSSTSGIQEISLEESGGSTSAVLTVSENPNNVQLSTTFTVTITATSRCGEISSAATATYTLIDCGPPPVPRNGSLEIVTNTVEGSVVIYSCDPSLVPEGRMVSVCTRTGWSPNPGFNCSVVNCGMPSTHMNGSIMDISSTLVGAEIIFGCNPGFVPADRRTAICISDGITADGTWTPDPTTLVCNASPVDCGNFTLTNGVNVEPYSTTTVSSVIFYLCQQAGFAPSSISSMCGEDERWSPDPSQVTCDMVTPPPTTVNCSGPPLPPINGSIGDYTSAVEGSMVVFFCNEGLIPEGRNTATCASSGSWAPNPADLVCTEPQPEGEGSGNEVNIISCNCLTSNAITAVVSCAVSFIVAAVIGAVVHYSTVRKKSKCQKLYSLIAARKQHKQQPAPVYEDVVGQSQRIEMKENVAYGPVQP